MQFYEINICQVMIISTSVQWGSYLEIYNHTLLSHLFYFTVVRTTDFSSFNKHKIPPDKHNFSHIYTPKARPKASVESNSLSLTGRRQEGGYALILSAIAAPWSLVFGIWYLLNIQSDLCAWHHSPLINSCWNNREHHHAQDSHKKFLQHQRETYSDKDITESNPLSYSQQRDQS